MDELIAFKACLYSIVIKLYNTNVFNTVKNLTDAEIKLLPLERQLEISEDRRKSKKNDPIFDKSENVKPIFRAYRFVLEIVAKIRNLSGYVSDAKEMIEQKKKTRRSSNFCFKQFNLYFFKRYVDESPPVAKSFLSSINLFSKSPARKFSLVPFVDWSSDKTDPDIVSFVEKGVIKLKDAVSNPKINMEDTIDVEKLIIKAYTIDSVFNKKYINTVPPSISSSGKAEYLLNVTTGSITIPGYVGSW